MGWLAPSEDEKPARVNPAAACEVASAVRTTAEMIENYFLTFSVAGLTIRPW